MVSVELFIDSANLQEIKYWAEILPIDGVATNPSLIARGGLRTAKAVEKIFGVIGNDKLVHAQVVAQDFEDILQEAALIQGLHENMLVKIPVTLDGLKAIKELAAEGMKITATAVVTAHQGILAAKAGATYIAPYVNRIDNISADGLEVASDLVKILAHYRFKAKVVGASFKNARQVLSLLQAGAHGVAIGSELLQHITTHSLTDASGDGFLKEYVDTFGTTEL